MGGNKICRTPPNPQSEHHWKLDINQQYPFHVLEYLHPLGLAEKTHKSLKVFPPLVCDKWMYAASKKEHLLPTSAQLFAITESSFTHLLCTDQFSRICLTRYAAKSEEHADGKISCGPEGKTFRLRDDGIKNKSLLGHERKKDRKVEHISCQLLSITESVFWLLGEPYGFTNMSFIHIQNVFVELRCAGARLLTERDDQLSLLNFRNYVLDLAAYKK